MTTKNYSVTVQLLTDAKDKEEAKSKIIGILNKAERNKFGYRIICVDEEIQI